MQAMAGAPSPPSKIAEIGVARAWAIHESASPYAATPASAPYTPSHVFPGLIPGASFLLPKARPAKYAAMSATHTRAAIARRSQGLASRSTMNANHVGHTTSQPAAAQTHGEGRAFFASHAGAAAIQNAAERMNAVEAAEVKAPSGSRA